MFIARRTADGGEARPESSPGVVRRALSLHLGPAAAAVAARPASLFLALSLLFGTLIAIVNPPLRGPDETAHFLRVWGIAQGEVLASDEVEGRLGVRLAARLYPDFLFFQRANGRFRDEGGDYFTYFSRFLHLPAELPATPVFVLYEGSEGYSPAAYPAHVLAAWAADGAGLAFVPTVYLMRLAGLLLASAVIAAAIRLTPRLGWAFFLVGMLPSALYGRTVIGADGAALAFAMMATALALASALRPDGGPRPWVRSVWTVLAVLVKPPQLALVLLEALRAPWRGGPAGWRSAAVVVLPAVVLGPLWVALAGGRFARWRIVESTGLPPGEFDPVRKLAFIAGEPLHFPAVLLASLWETGHELWRQLVGIHGWLDTPMRGWVYPVLTLLLLPVCWERLAATRGERVRLGLVALGTALAYALAVYLVFFLVWTPTTAQVIWGVQGRYFVVALPALAIAVAALARRPLPVPVRAALAIAGAVLGAAATLEAVVRVNWLGG